jgi:hypothetical protein
MTKELRTEIEIKASPEIVWKILSDLADYPKWNPFLCHAIGKAVVGEPVVLDFQPDSKGMKLHCIVTTAEPNRKLSWKYFYILPFLMRGEHSFTIEPLGKNRVRFVELEVFDGLLVPSQARDIDTNTKRGFEAMDEALKKKAEAS